MEAHTISGINRLSEQEKREIYSRIIPQKLLSRFQIPPTLIDSEGNDLLTLVVEPGTSSAEMRLHHKVDGPDPIFYGHIVDTINGQIHVLLYILNDPDSPRFDVDRLPNGTPTKFGTVCRNLPAEQAALEYGLTPGQIRKGLGLLGEVVQVFEEFITSLGHDLYFVEPLFYHNAIIFEKYGLAYEKGRKVMDQIQTGFSEGGELLARLDSSNPFRQPNAANSIRLRSWAIHDGILGEPFTEVTMYKRIGKPASLDSCVGCVW